MAAAACSSKGSEKDLPKSHASTTPSVPSPTERSRPDLIRPRLDPKMVYDERANYVVDTETGDRFRVYPGNPINRIYDMTITNRADTILYAFECRSSESRGLNGILNPVYEILWSVRGEDYGGKMIDDVRAGRIRAQDDPLDRLGSFLRARDIGLDGGREKRETYLIDRRLDDVQSELR